MFLGFVSDIVREEEKTSHTNIDYKNHKEAIKSKHMSSSWFSENLKLVYAKSLPFPGRPAG